MSTFEASIVRSQIRAICNAAENVQPGQFIFIKGYRSDSGEVSDYWLHYGRDYGKVKERFVAQIRKTLWEDQPLDLEIRYRTFVDQKTNKEYPRDKEGSGRVEVEISLKNLDATDPIVRKILVDILQSYSKQQKDKAFVFSKKATGIYVNEANNSFCIRMSTLAWKKVVCPSPQEVKAYSTKPAAIKKAIKDRFLKLREFRLDRFESISIGGNILSFSSCVTENSGLVKENIKNG